MATAGAAWASARELGALRLRGRAACEPADAGAVGFGSFESLSSLSTWLWVTDCDFGTGYLWASFFRRPYVYVLPYASRSMMNLPRRSSLPILTIRPSWTAMTGAPAFA